MDRPKKPWEIEEEKLLAKENAYINNLNWFQQIVDNHIFYLIFMFITMNIAFLVGLLIGLVIFKA